METNILKHTSRPVNPSDIAYVNYNNTDDLQVYVTYNIILKNKSNTLPMPVNSIVNYYDSNYTIYTGQGTATSSGWQEQVEIIMDIKKHTIQIKLNYNQNQNQK
ncbi:MAG: hypothetical protein V8R51_02520 [Clostridia bacterium]